MNPLPNASEDLTPVVSAVRDAVMSARPLARYYPGKVVVAGLPCAFVCRLFSVLPDPLADMLM